MVTGHWVQISDAGTYARQVLREEASEIPVDLIEGRPWTQIMIEPSALLVDEQMIARHDDDPVHQERRDKFRQAILLGRDLPPLIAIGPNRHLVDGYARLRAVRLLKIHEVSVVVQAFR